MTAAAAASPASVEASISRVVPSPWRSMMPGSTARSWSLVGLSAWSPSCSMQSARHASVSTRARLSIVPSMRPLAAASRTATAVASPPARRSTASRWSSPRAARTASSSSSVVARRARSSSPSDCRRVFIWFTGHDATGVGRSGPPAPGATWQVSVVPSVDCGDGRGATVRPRPAATQVLPTMSDDGQPASADGATRGWDEFEPLYDAHHERLYKLAVLLCHGSEAMAEDAVAETFLRVYPAWAEGRVERFFPYARQTLVHQVLGRPPRRRRAPARPPRIAAAAPSVTRSPAPRRRSSSSSSSHPSSARPSCCATSRTCRTTRSRRQWACRPATRRPRCPSGCSACAR